MKLTRKDKLSIVLLNAGAPIKGADIKHALKEQFNLNLVSGELSTLFRDTNLFKKEGTIRDYSYSLTPAGEQQARTASAGAPVVETKAEPQTTSLADLARQVLLDNDNAPMGPTEIAQAIENKYHKGASVQVVNAALSGSIVKKNPIIVRAGRGLYQASTGPNDENMLPDSMEPRRKSQWTLTLVNGTQQFAANISAAAAKRIVNTVLFKSDSEELN